MRVASGSNPVEIAFFACFLQILFLLANSPFFKIFARSANQLRCVRCEFRSTNQLRTQRNWVLQVSRDPPTKMHACGAEFPATYYSHACRGLLIHKPSAIEKTLKLICRRFSDQHVPAKEKSDPVRKIQKVVRASEI